MTKLNIVLNQLFFAVCILATSVVNALDVERGPYLQRATSDEIIVKWRTDSNTESVVRYGTSAGSLNQTATDSGTQKNHRVIVSGLSPNTTYYYSIGNSSSALASGNSYRFTTPPEVGTAKKTRIWAIGDAGTANSNQRSVYKAYQNYDGYDKTNLWIMLGDNAYNDGKLIDRNKLASHFGRRHFSNVHG